MAVFDPTQGFNAFAQGAQIGGNIRQRQTEAKLAPMVAAGDYQGAAQYAGQRGDLQGAEYFKAQYGEQLKGMKAEELAAATKRAEDLARTAAGLRSVPYEQRRTVLQQQLPMLQGMGIDPQQLAQFDPTDQAIDGVLAQVTPLAELLKSQEGYTLAPGARRFDAQGNMIAENPVAAKPQEQWEDYTPPGGMPGLFQRNAATGEVKRVAAPPSGGIRIGPDGTVQIGGPVEGLGYGSAPKGKDAAIAFDRDGNPVVTPGPQQEAYNKAIRGLGEFQAQNAIVIEDIDRALNSISGWSTGAGAALKDLPVVGGITPAGQMESLLSTIQSNVGFDKLQAMREASPTGGALGSVTEKELAFLQSVFGSLRQDTSPENVRYNLTRLKSHMQGREQRLQEAIAADFPSLATTAQRRAGANQQIQELNDLLEFMTPEERALFEGDQ